VRIEVPYRPFGEPRLAHALLPLATGVLAGGLVATTGAASTTALWVGGAAALALLGLGCASGRLQVLVVSLAAGFAGMVALTLCRATPLPADHIARRVSAGTAAVEGVVAASDVTGVALRLTIQVDRYRSARGRGGARGLLGITVAHPRHTWPVGARVRVVGRLHRPRNFGNPGGYDFERALARRGILVTTFLWDDDTLVLLSPAPAGVAALLGELRAGIEAHISAVADQPARGFLAAVLIGAGGAVDSETQRVLARTGLSHVVSVSGFHLAVVAATAIVAVRWLLGRSEWVLLRYDVSKLAALGGIAPVLAYAGIAGGSVPASRALLMYAALLAALFAGRPADGLRALAAAAVVLGLATPDIAADISFELSFVSVMALILTARRSKPEAGGDVLAGAALGAARPGTTPVPAARAAAIRAAAQRFVLASLKVSLAAALATAPLTAWHFQLVSLIAPLANLIVLPLLGPATLLPGLAALPFLAIAPSLGDPLLGLAARAAEIGLRVAAALAAAPGAAVATPMPSLLEIALVYALLALPFVPRTIAGPQLTSGGAAALRRPRRLVAAVLVVAGLADAGYWSWERLANPRLRVTFLAVGQGDAAVVELPRGGVMVIDGGGLSGDFDTGERLIAPFLRARKILHLDALVLSHPQLDHYGGLAYLAEHFAPREFWSNGMGAHAAGFARLEQALDRAGTRRRVLSRGSPPLVRRGVRIEVLHPGPERTVHAASCAVGSHRAAAGGADLNNGSLVLRLTYGATSFVFSGDIEGEAEAEIAAATAPAAAGGGGVRTAAAGGGSVRTAMGGDVTRPAAGTGGIAGAASASESVASPVAASTVLKVPHHGSATSSSPALLAAVAPRVAVISAGAENRFGFPAPVVVERLRAAGAAIWRTDRDGAVRVESDGARLTVSTPCGGRRTRTLDLKSPHPFGSS
jgi:competence protein ComEC